MIQTSDRIEHRHLGCGIELGVRPMAGRPLVAIDIRVFGGYAYESPSHLGVTSVLEEAITKGTAKHDGRALNDAFDDMGASHSTCTGRETVAFGCVCLPEFIDPVVALLTELICTPTFPEDACQVAVELSQQHVAALDDEPGELAKKLLHQQAYGEPLGRHALGEKHTLATIGRTQIVDHWKRYFAAPRMQVSIAGALDVPAVIDSLEKHFEGFDHRNGTGCSRDENRPNFCVNFTPAYRHYHKDLEQEQIAFCFPGALATDNDFAVEKVLVGVLSGGMSSRLFTEVREKQGLVYWVGAWSDQPRTGGMVHLGASTTPQNVERTYVTLLREINRLADDLTDLEVERAITGLEAQLVTRGDVTRAKASELLDDLFYYGRPIPTEEKLAKIKSVTVADVRRYLEAHPRDKLSIVTLGTRKLSL